MSEQWIAIDCEEPDLEILSESALAMAQATIQKAMDESNTKRAHMAKRMGTQRSFVSRMLRGSHNLTVKTMAKALAACGYEVEFGLTPIRWNWVTATDVCAVKSLNCNTVPSGEGTLLLTSADSLAAGCPSPTLAGC